LGEVIVYQNFGKGTPQYYPISMNVFLSCSYWRGNL